MTAEPVPIRTVRIAASGDLLIQAIREHRPESGEWRIAALEGPVEPDALVLVDFDDAEARRATLDTIRGGGFSGPVLILAAPGSAPRDSSEEVIVCPVRLGTLLARIDAHWAGRADESAMSLGPYLFASAERVLRHGGTGETIRLTEIECRLLEELAAAGGALVGRDALLDRVWHYSPEADTHTVETHIWRLRQKIETDDPETHFLVTEAGGYRFRRVNQ